MPAFGPPSRRTCARSKPASRARNGHEKHRFASVPSIPKFASRGLQGATSFGIGTLEAHYAREGDGGSSCTGRSGWRLYCGL
jgi:hypothetical protein